MVIYLDLVAVLNFLIDGLLLYGTARLGAAALRWRLLLGALLGALYGVLVYLPPFGFLQHFFWKILCCAVMLGVAFGFRRSTLRLGAVFVALTMVLCGAVYSVELLRHGSMELRGKALFFPVSFFSLLFTATAVCLACRLLLPRLTHGQDSIVPLEIELRGRKLRFSAFRDTGNSLSDPLTGAPVITVCASSALKLFPPELGLHREDFNEPLTLMERLRPLSPRLIPYRAVGVSSGLLLTLSCRVTLHRKTSSMPVAFSPTPLSDGGAYDALIGGM